jgi:hypothetical protein
MGETEVEDDTGGDCILFDAGGIVANGCAGGDCEDAAEYRDDGCA